jgi:hypothetical protein
MTERHGRTGRIDDVVLAMLLKTITGAAGGRGGDASDGAKPS